MAKGLSAYGRFEEAVKYSTDSLAKAPDQNNKEDLTKLIEKLKAKQDVY